MIIAVDFDGTIVEHAYPAIGKPIPFAIETLIRLQQEGHRLILWSVREGRLLQEALDYCAERGLRFFATNKTFL
jgi:hydroxymethylpyrimidine pyrophosphatase-like HAD family hydrolase